MDLQPNQCGSATLHLNVGFEETYDRSLPVTWEGECGDALRVARFP